MKLIAETAWHHEGDFLFMKNLINKIITDTDADIIKMHVTINFDDYMKSNHDLYENLKSMLFTKDQWEELINMVKNSDKELMVLTNDFAAIEFVSSFDPEIIELHSTCLNVPTLQKAILDKLHKEVKVVIGVGGSTTEEIDNAVQFFYDRRTILMFGFQNYPTRYEDVNISKIRKIQSRYPDKLFGYADHTGWNEINNELITLMVAANNMNFIEKHVTNAFGQERIDYSAAISFEMFNSLARNLKILNQLYGNGNLELNDAEKSYSCFGPMKLAAVAKSNMEIGHSISIKDIVFRRTKETTDLSQVDIINLIGKSLIIPISKNDILNSTYFSQFK